MIDDVEGDLRELVSARPDATLAELCIAIEGRTGVGVSRATMCRELRRLGFTQEEVTRADRAMHVEGARRREAFLAEV